MPGIGHAIIGCAAGRLFAGRDAPRARLAASMTGFAALSMAPDLDVAAFGMGIPYTAEWGHRGALHSPAMGLGLALAAALAGRSLGQSFLRVFLLAAVVAVSHGLLDTLTSGGEGIAVLWPFSHERFFAPYRPIPVSSIGPAALSARGWPVIRTELLMFSPLLIYALWPRRRGRVTRSC